MRPTMIMIRSANITNEESDKKSIETSQPQSHMNRGREQFQHMEIAVRRITIESHNE